MAGTQVSLQPPKATKNVVFREFKSYVIFDITHFQQTSSLKVAGTQVSLQPPKATKNVVFREFKSYVIFDITHFQQTSSLKDGRIL